VLGVELTTTIGTLAAQAGRQQAALHGAAASDGTLTLVITDIEGSTATLDRLGDRRYMELLRWHNDVVRDAVQKWDGFEVNRAGDGFLLAFPAARRALHCSLDIQERISSDANDFNVRVRVGAHAGEPLRDGEDLYGHVVHYAARVASCASGGQVLASSLLRDLTAGSDEFLFALALETTLKGFDGSHSVFAVSRHSRSGVAHHGPTPR
jgi:class 3 adenylate cyclase